MDDGLSRERTILARRRTALAVLITSAVVTRWAVKDVGPFTVLACALPGVLVAHHVLDWRSPRRRAMSAARRPDGRVGVVTAAATVVTCLAALLAIAL
jgi:uncharacterized membrane protein YidH (DUF202 family)